MNNLKAKMPFARGVAGGRLDLLLPLGWPLTEAPITWRWRSSTGQTAAGEGTIDDLPQSGGAPVYAWTPAAETLLTRTTLPTTSRAKVAQALPFALEEQLLDDPENLHFAWRRNDDGVLAVAVTAKEHLQTWLAGLSRAGVKPSALCPATLIVPWSPSCWSAALVGDELIVRTGPTEGFTAPMSIDEPPALLGAALKERQESGHAPEYLIVFQPPSSFSADTWSTALGVPVRVEAASFWDVAGDSAPALNLLQGEFAPAGEMGRHLRPWLPAAVMLALWLIGTIAFDVAEWWKLHRRYEANMAEMTTILTQVFPEIKTVLDPYQQMQRGMDGLMARGGTRQSDMLVLLGRVGGASQGQARLRLRGLQYSDRSLTLDVTLPDAPALEQVRQSLQSSGLQADLVSSNARGKEIDGKLRLRPRSSTPAAPGAKS
ncbi:MAG TPA: type II secretion system protein GspL [Burkholderiales bacterium]|nr:type II secretion system protein GspL [Burkholderiales bacterium]